MTEDQARKTACWRGPDGPGDVMLRGAGPVPVYCCIGSECMAWRWVTLPREKSTYSAADDGAAGDGYCGAAGRP